VAWSIAEYLASLEKGVGELLKEKDKPEAKTEPKPKSKAEPAAPESPNEQRRPRACKVPFRHAFRRLKPGARSIHAATDATRGGHDHQRCHRHRQGVGSAPAWALMNW
jgi:hypothetical protein